VYHPSGRLTLNRSISVVGLVGYPTMTRSATKKKKDPPGRSLSEFGFFRGPAAAAARPAAEVEEEKKDEEEDAPPPPNAAMAAPEVPDENNEDGTKFVGRRVSKYFYDPPVLFNGTVSSYDDTVGSKDDPDEWGVWAIHYDDGDDEEFLRDELDGALELYRKEGWKMDEEGEDDGSELDQKSSAAGTSAKKKRAKDDNRSSDEDEDSEDEHFEVKKKATKKNSTKKKKKPARKKTKVESAAAASSPSNDNEVEDEPMNGTPTAAAPPTPPTTTSRSGRVRKPVVHEKMFADWSSGASSSDESDADVFASRGQKKAARGKAGGRKKGGASKKKKTKTKARAEESEASEASSVSSEESEAMDLETEESDDFGDMELDSSEDDDFEDLPKKKKKVTKKQKKKPGAKKMASKKAGSKKAAMDLDGDEDGDVKDELEATIEKETYTPKNNPAKLVTPEDDFVDFVGIDPTGGIVEGIVREQVKKIGGLLIGAIEAGDMTPVKLLTACSGTDAPSIALALVKEELDRMFGPDGHPFRYEHKMSCEIEPFKQSYISRNFPGTVLFPDITKLSEGGTVADVYGRQQSLPDGNFFVAGTSCKDFSTMRRNGRKDIEDKGQSGQTFLAAEAFLQLKGPDRACFENVMGAPWPKMQEYIEGMVRLSTVYDQIKGIESAGKKKSEAKELTFSIADGKYRVEAVPRQVGVKAGAVVAGFIRGDDEDSAVVPIKDVPPCSGEITLYSLCEKHDIDMENDTLVFDKKYRYKTHLCKVTTKKYGLPQTRERRYLFVWRSEDPDDDLGEYMEEILHHLEAPIVHSIAGFFLPPTHDSIRSMREALRSGPGQILARERARDPDFWDYAKNRNKDAPRHMRFRRDTGIEERSRWLTGWDTMNRQELAPSLMPEYFDKWNSRRLDMIDCFGIAAHRDATGRDPLHHLFTWDISQNVTRAPFRDADLGVTGCITPAGELCVPHLGRSMMGFEKLMLQGIPWSRLKLGNESEVQLSDLAGNAMSLPVVLAMELAALTAKQLRRERLANGKYSLANAALTSKYDDKEGRVLAERGDLYETKPCGDESNAVDEFKAALGLADDAYTSSALCTCETSGQTSRACILECSGCGLSICQDCADRCRTCSHDLHEKDKKGSMGPTSRTSGEKDPRMFERRLRQTLPATLRLGSQAEELLKDGEGLEAYSFKLQQVERREGRWEVIYGAIEDFGNGRQVAELRVKLGKVLKLTNNGLLATIKCFGPAIRSHPRRGRLLDSAKLLMLKGNDNESVSWQVPSQAAEVKASIVGSGETPSVRVQVGLTNVAAKALRGHKVKKNFIPPIKSRNDLLAYHPRWKTWPKTIVIEDTDPSIDGAYTRLPCEQTIVHSALWRRRGEGSPDMYIYIRPDLNRANLDVAVVSPSPSYRDGAEIAELIDWIPENALEEKTQRTTVRLLKWRDEASLSVQVATDDATVSSPDNFSASEDKPNLLCAINGLAVESVKSLYGEATGPNVLVDLNGSKGVQNTKRLVTVAAPSLLKHAAESGLPLEEGKWHSLEPSSSDIALGRSPVHVPLRPDADWVKVNGRDGLVERVYDAEASNSFYLAFHARPKAWAVVVNSNTGSVEVRMNPFVPVHQAAAPLVAGLAEDEEITASYRLTELSSMSEPKTEPFKVPNSDAYGQFTVNGLALPLYPRQAKALTRMRDIEEGRVQFNEEERSEDVLPGIGFCLIGRAQRKSNLRGGVLADSIGSGKTAVTIALILADVEEARTSRVIDQGISGATLIVVPPALIDQWDDERKKFTGSQLKCLKVDSTAALKKLTVKEICCADIIICPVSINEEGKGKNRPYTANLCSKASAKSIPIAPTKVTQREAPSIEGTFIRNQASGPDPYVGNRGSQRSRDAQAYYGHCYSTAIESLREKKFSPSERGVPFEYFTFRRVVLDECHETLVTSKQEKFTDSDFKDTARRGAREFLGVAQTDSRRRPLRATLAHWGLTGTPMLETYARITEMANLMGGTYLTGAENHWRREERESGRDMFLNLQQSKRSRDYRCAVQDAAHKYVQVACQRNRGEKLNVKLNRCEARVNMSSDDGDLFLAAVKKATEGTAETFSFSLGDVPDLEKTRPILEVTARSGARSNKLLETIRATHESDPTAKIIVFADVEYGGHPAACKSLKDAGEPFVSIDEGEAVELQNERISWFRHQDVTEEERARPRILVLSFEQAAGHNLQTACNNVIMFEPRYSGLDAVADASVEEQAIGRVMRQGQTKDVNLTRIILCGPSGERSTDDWLVERNTDEETLMAATSNFD